MRPDEGTRLKAYVVPMPQVSDIAMFLAQLRSWIDTQLRVAERPKAIRVGSQLPVTASGKPVRLEHRGRTGRTGRSPALTAARPRPLRADIVMVMKSRHAC